MAKKIILDLCGGSGSWSRPYADASYDVRNITLPDYDVRTYMPPEGVYGILAAPPCTEFSLAKGNRPRDFEKGMETIIACLQIIWNCRYRNPLSFWCLENPRGFLRQFLGKPSATIQYWQYGDNLGKPTDLWGYFELPKAVYTEPPGLLKEWDKIKTIKSVQNLSGAEVRAKTPPNWAQAFFEANR